jgi:hypothetical protein
MKKTEFKMLLDVSSMHRKAITAEVIQNLIGLDDKNMLMSGEDSGLQNVWEEICVQKQVDYSMYWDAYENTIENCIKTSLSKQPQEVIDLFLYIGNIDCDEEHECYFLEDILEEIKSDILLEAEYYKNQNITNFFEKDNDEEDDEEDDEEE